MTRSSRRENGLSIWNLKILSLLVAIFSLTGRAMAQESPLRDHWSDSLLWVYHPGDEARYADPDFDDRDWEALPYTWIEDENMPEQGWNGIGWFRTHFSVDSTEWNQTQRVRFDVTGAAELYLDGERVASVGTVGSSRYDETSVSNPDMNPRFVELMFSGGARHVLSVRHSNYIAADMHLLGGPIAGFGLRSASPNDDDLRLSQTLRSLTAEQYAFTFIPLTFALLYFLLFAFFTEEKHYLHFALLATCVAAMTFMDLQYDLIADGASQVLYRKFFTLVFVLLILVLSRFIYGVFHDTLPRQFWLILFAVVVLAFWGFVNPYRAFSFGIIAGLISLVEISRTVIVATIRRKSDAWIIAVGLFIFIVGISYDLLLDLGLIPEIAQTSNGYYYGFTGMIVAMAVYLARHVARTNTSLKEQLHQVQLLSEKNLQKEREARALEVSRLRLEAENERKSQELEDARVLQLSMLPDGVPSHPGYQIAVHFQPATEVGGDYYDFHVSPDGSLTVAIGDATGHGMRAGTLVTATKSLFTNLIENDSLEDILLKSSKTLKAIGLPKLYMAFALVRFTDHEAEFAGAGIPHALVHRVTSGTIESIPLKGVPLGSPGNVPYHSQRVSLESGDTVVLMSDGFPELFNPDGDMLGYEAVVSIVEEKAGQSPNALIQHMKSTIADWLAGGSADDDVTIVVIKIR